jgi:xanthine dehydrogenase accessory factor
MKDIISTLIEWEENKVRAAIATVLQTWGSSPRQAGAHMAISEEGKFAGSVSGGCVETAVIQESLDVISSGRSKRIKYGISDQTAFEVGLACGGEIEVFISPINWRDFSPILETVKEGIPCKYQIILDEYGTISKSEIKTEMQKYPHLDTETKPEIFLLYAPPDPEIIIVGGVNISQDLVNFSKLMGFRTTIIDPRKAFATKERFQNVDTLLNLWPEDAFIQINITSNTAIVILTHDDKVDIPAIKLALESPAFYVGALGSKKTQARRKKVLAEMGVPEELRNKIFGPIGLDIGAQKPTEIALAIIAEITAVKNEYRGNTQKIVTV